MKHHILQRLSALSDSAENNPATQNLEKFYTRLVVELVVKYKGLLLRLSGYYTIVFFTSSTV